MRGSTCEAADGHSICVGGSSGLLERAHPVLAGLNAHPCEKEITRLGILADF